MTTSSPAGWSPSRPARTMHSNAEVRARRRLREGRCLSRRASPPQVGRHAGPVCRRGVPRHPSRLPVVDRHPLRHRSARAVPTAPATTRTDCARVPEKISSRRDRASSPRPTCEVLAVGAVGLGQRDLRPVDLVLAGHAPHLHRGLGEAQQARRADRVRRQHAARHVHRERAVERGVAAARPSSSPRSGRRCRGPRATSARTS